MPIAINLSAKIVLITGASQGIGAQIARTFHAAGATIVLNHVGLKSTKEDAEKLSEELNDLRERSTLVVAADVADAEQVQAMMQQIRESYNGLDFLINNAAILRDKTIAKMTLDEWHSVMNVNLNGVFHCCKFGLEIMRDNGAIVNMSSITAIVGFYGQSNYAAAKAGVAAMTRVLARETGRRNIRVNAIAPGVIKTAMSATIPENVRAEMLKNVPLSRFGEPREIAEVSLFLCSPLASYISGQIIEVNGGWRG